MDYEQEQQLVGEIKRYVTENLPLSKMSDEELEERIEEVVTQRVAGRYCSIEQRLSIIQQVYSSIRGFGMLDSIMNDDTITEVPHRYGVLQCEIATYLLNKRGAEGETSHSENGISRGYESADVPESLIGVVVPFCGVI
jgi:hypothetical protein